MPTKSPLLLLLISFGLCSALVAQTEREFVEKTKLYRINLVSDWQSFSYTDSFGRPETEFIFRERDQGLLKISREDLAGQSLLNKVRSDLEDLRLHLACSSVSREEFAGGHLDGIRVALYCFQDNHRMVGVYYYLQEGEAVWVLRFTAREDSPGLARDLTDRMARSFCGVCPIP